MDIKRKGNNETSVLRRENDIILKEISCNIKEIKTVLDAGSGPFSQDGNGKLYKDYFPFAKYYTLDNNHGKSRENHFNMDLHDLSSLRMQFDIVLCLSVLEHVKNPFAVANQLEIISNKYIFIVVPFIFPFHPKINGDVKDYWRFTDSGLIELFSNSKVIWIKKMKSVIRSVKDKKKIIKKPHKGWISSNSATGYAALFKIK